jgi:hypothetical protein
VSAIAYAVDTSVPNGEILSILHCHSVLSGAEFQTKLGAASGDEPRKCLNVIWRRLRGDAYTHLHRPNVQVVVLEGDTVKTISFLDRVFLNWSQDAREAAADIQWSASAVLTPITIPKTHASHRPLTMHAEAATLLHEQAIAAAAQPPSCFIFRSSGRSDMYTVSSAHSGNAFRVSPTICEHYAQNGKEFLQTAIDLAALTTLNWTMPNAVTFMEGLLRRGYSVSQIRNAVVPALQLGGIHRPSGSGGMRVLHQSIDQLLNPKPIPKRQI